MRFYHGSRSDLRLLAVIHDLLNVLLYLSDLQPLTNDPFSFFNSFLLKKKTLNNSTKK